jgi:hypothetical protein
MVDNFSGVAQDVLKIILNKVIDMSPISIMCIRFTCKNWNVAMKEKTLKLCCQTYLDAIWDIFSNLFPKEADLVQANEFLKLFLKISRIKKFPKLHENLTPQRSILRLVTSNDTLVQIQKQCDIYFPLDDVIKYGNSILLGYYKNLFILDKSYKEKLLVGYHTSRTTEWIFNEILTLEFISDHWRQIPIGGETKRFNNKTKEILRRYNMPVHFYEKILLHCIYEKDMNAFLMNQKIFQCKSKKICDLAYEKNVHNQISQVCYCNEKITLKNSDGEESELKKIKSDF